MRLKTKNLFASFTKASLLEAEVLLFLWKTISINVRIFVARFPIKATKPMIRNNERRTGLAIISYLSENRDVHSSKPVSQSFMPFWTNFLSIDITLPLSQKNLFSPHSWRLSSLAWLQSFIPSQTKSLLMELAPPATVQLNRLFRQSVLVSSEWSSQWNMPSQ